MYCTEQATGPNVFPALDRRNPDSADLPVRRRRGGGKGGGVSSRQDDETREEK